MIDYKIIELDNAKLPDILLFRDLGNCGDHCVVIHACGTKEGDGNYIASDRIIFDSVLMAQSFIMDFSVRSAIAWCNQYGILK